jgi:membrane-bound metal-dependent hydrolase YbcI (DUF457 family)
MSPLGHFLTAASAASAFAKLSGSAGIGAAISTLLHWAETGCADALPTGTLLFLASAGIVLGARGPDRLEVPSWNRRTNIRRSLIPHRTLTHWPWPWAFVLLAGGFWLGRERGLAQAALAVLCGFAASGLLHLLFDAMTPTGIPLRTPFGPRSSLNAYKTGTAGEWLCVAGFCAAMAGLAMLANRGYWAYFIYRGF